MEFLSLSRRRSSSRNVPSGEEWEEAAVFAGYFFSFFRQCRAWSQASAVGIFGGGRRPTRFALTVAWQKPAITKEKVSGTLGTVNWIAFSIFIALFLIELSYSECLSYRESSKTSEIDTFSFEWRVNVFPQCIAIVFLTRWRRFPSFSFVSLQCFFVTFCWPIIGYTKSWYTGMSIENNAYRLRYSDFPQPTRFFRATFLDPISSLSWSLEQATSCFKIAVASPALVNSEPYESQIKGVHRGRW